MNGELRDWLRKRMTQIDERVNILDGEGGQW
jgi:hypothetical protein